MPESPSEKERSRRRRQTPEYQAYQREYYHKAKRTFTPEQIAARRQYQREWRRKNRMRVKETSAANERMRLYGLTQEQFDALMDQQDGECAICQRLLTKPLVDHDHLTGTVRGLLCQRCNTAIGMLGDNVGTAIAAAQYLLNSWSGASSTKNRLVLSVN